MLLSGMRGFSSMSSSKCILGKGFIEIPDPIPFQEPTSAFARTRADCKTMGGLREQDCSMIRSGKVISGAQERREIRAGRGKTPRVSPAAQPGLRTGFAVRSLPN